ncbi:MAG: PP2C family serine/threonine-protein phosphatase [Aliiglaciecola sp.]|uniref:PP2C family protein-serine/threonine phosphatase n=1 Tax=Aliiglaciecola sp. TaxID=1872441 RepID=UPI003297D296
MSNNRIIFEKSEQAGRKYNQDRYAYHLSEDNSDILIVVADGVGGTKQGELAAEIIADKSGDFWQKREEFANGEDFLNAFADECNLAIKQTCEQGTSTAATLTALLQLNGELVSAHAGDSRIYQYDHSGKVKQSKDHSLAYAKFLMGEISEDELATHPSQTQLLNCLDGSESAHCEINHWQINEGEYFALCTDGFWEIFDNDEILELIKNDNREYIFANRIDETLQTKPGQDNTTVVLSQLDKSKAVPIAPVANAEASEGLPQNSPSNNTPASSPSKTVAQDDAKPLLNWKIIVLGLVALMLIVLLYFTYRNYMQSCCSAESPLAVEEQLDSSSNGDDFPAPVITNPSSELESNVAGEAQKPAQAGEQVIEQVEKTVGDVGEILEQVEPPTSEDLKEPLSDAKHTLEEALPDAEEVLSEAEGSLSDAEDAFSDAEGSLPQTEGSLPQAEGSLPEAEDSNDLESSSSALKNFVNSDEVVPDAAMDEQGNVSGPADLNANLDSAPSLSLDVAPGEDPIAKLEARLSQDGSVSKGSKLDKTDEMKDQYTEIITVQLKVKDTPVYGAVLRYQKTSSGIEVIAGKVSNLPNVPEAPTHDFMSCFSQYQNAQEQQGKAIEKGQSEPVLYIDAASSGYFWLADIIVTETGQAFDLFLLDKSCESLRLVPKHVSH